MKEILKRLVVIFATIIILGGLYMFADYVLSPIFKKQNPTTKPITKIDKSKEVPLKVVNNLGYTFYLGEIDNNNSVINDSFKTEITKIVYDAKFPKKLLENLPIVVVNSLALKSGQYISTRNDTYEVFNFGPEFLYEGGFYADYDNKKGIIYINKEALGKMSLADILTHELGHAIGYTLTDADWKTYYELRSIPTKNIGSQLWNLSPKEDFAEVYKNVFTGLPIRTSYDKTVSLKTKEFIKTSNAIKN